MDAKVTWREGLSFTGTAGSGFDLPLGASQEVGGVNDGFRPLELMAVSLAGCTAMDVISILRKKHQQVTHFEVAVRAEQVEDHPRVFSSATIEYRLTGFNVDESAVLRAIELSSSRYCPAQNMLAKVMPINLKYEIYEGENLEKRRIIKSGTIDRSKY